MGSEMEVATRFALLNAGETDKLVVNKYSTNTKSYKSGSSIVRKYLAEKNK